LDFHQIDGLALQLYRVTQNGCDFGKLVLVASDKVEFAGSHVELTGYWYAEAEESGLSEKIYSAMDFVLERAIDVLYIRPRIGISSRTATTRSRKSRIRDTVLDCRIAEAENLGLIRAD
jgi:hypothetical protein